jgi:hypothetical protein
MQCGVFAIAAQQSSNRRRRRTSRAGSVAAVRGQHFGSTHVRFLLCHSPPCFDRYLKRTILFSEDLKEEQHPQGFELIGAEAALAAQVAAAETSQQVLFFFSARFAVLCVKCLFSISD